MNFTVYPAVDISEGRCVRLLQGRFGTETVYSDDPVEVALGLAKAGARWLHIVDLEGAKTGVGANRELVLEVVRNASCPVQAGGGLRSMDDVVEVLAAGASRAVLGTVALEDPTELARACNRFGERIAVSLDARGDELTSHGWTVGSGMPLPDAVRVFAEAGVSMFIYTDVSRDGTMSGPDLAGVTRLAQKTSLPVIASGGVGTLDELRRVAQLQAIGVQGAIVGRALYEGKFTVIEAVRAADEVASGRYDPRIAPDGR
ncbi:MAG: 1-(5-phosphoribosyl)-5-[(5-phosphoribosylamino)methylideneamino]imidazole-4-carboxamide isomerase [Actinobacteria bacterium]|nr:1-(5-phosphoribosyl)-5-[(5-phosphoribosylamino)methylideneamino]imidazole-4-carboxamide isomerase [Actinomycetota bacterium]